MGRNTADGTSFFKAVKNSFFSTHVSAAIIITSGGVQNVCVRLKDRFEKKRSAASVRGEAEWPTSVAHLGLGSGIQRRRGGGGGVCRKKGACVCAHSKRGQRSAFSFDRATQARQVRAREGADSKTGLTKLSVSRRERFGPMCVCGGGIAAPA